MIALILEAELLAACTATRVDGTWASNAYNLADLSYGADHRDLRVEVRGGPVAVPALQFAASVATAMPSGIGVATHFTATPDTTANPLYRVVWDFAPTTVELGRALCLASADTVTAEPATRATDGSVLVTFCRGAAPMSGAYGRLHRPADPEDPQFRALVRALSLALFPRDGAARGGY